MRSDFCTKGTNELYHYRLHCFSQLAPNVLWTLPEMGRDACVHFHGVSADPLVEWWFCSSLLQLLHWLECGKGRSVKTVRIMSKNTCQSQYWKTDISPIYLAINTLRNLFIWNRSISSTKLLKTTTTKNKHQKTISQKIRKYAIALYISEITGKTKRPCYPNCTYLMQWTHIWKISHIIDDRLQDGWQCYHRVCSAPVDGLMRSLRNKES